KGNGAPVTVEIQKTEQPVVLAVTSYYSILWRFKLASEAKIKAIIVSGYFDQEFEGVPEGVPVILAKSIDLESVSKDRKRFYAYQPHTSDYRDTVEVLNDMTGLLVSTFQGQYQATAFVVDGKRGSDLAQKERKPRSTFPPEPSSEQLLKASAGADLHVV